MQEILGSRFANWGSFNSCGKGHSKHHHRSPQKMGELGLPIQVSS